MIRKLSVLLILALTISGCTIGGVPFKKVDSLKENEAVVYVYRPRAMVGGGVIYDVKANGQKITTLVHTSYFPYVAPAGEILFSAKTALHNNETSITLNTDPGKTYYIRGGTNMTAPGVHQPTLIVVPSVVGSAEIQKCVQY